MIFLIFILPPMVLLCLSAAVFLRITYIRAPGPLSFLAAVLLNYLAAVLAYALVMAVFGHEFYAGPAEAAWAWYLEGVLTWASWSALLWLPLMGFFVLLSRKWG